MEIKRINSYDDPRFDKDILLQHGAFLLDGETPCSFRITGRSCASVFCPKALDLAEAIEEFRFYAPHIAEFYNADGQLIKKYPDAEIIALDLKEIQPSQFYASEEKVEAISTFIHSGEDIIVQIDKIDGSYVSLDGHTRLVYAVQNGWNQVYGCLVDDAGEYTRGFVAEAKQRGVFTPYDIELVSQKEYEIKWHKFCDDYFAKQNYQEV